MLFVDAALVGGASDYIAAHEVGHLFGLFHPDENSRFISFDEPKDADWKKRIMVVPLSLKNDPKRLIKAEWDVVNPDP